MDAKVVPLGKLIDELNKIREKKRELNEKLKVVEGEYSALEEQIKQRLLAEDMDKGTGKTATVSISNVIVADVTNWDAFHAFIKKTGYFHLLQRRVSDPSFRELLEQQGAKKLEKAGLQPFVKMNLNLRAL